MTMSQHPFLEAGLSVLETRLKGSAQPGLVGLPPDVHPFVTIARETSAGATTLGQMLVPLLDEALGLKGWVFMDKNLLAHALAQRNLPARLAEHLPEDKISEFKGIVGELVGLHPPLWQLEEQVMEVILQLAQVGRVILVGRASFLITKSLPGGFHVRLVASKETRIQRTMKLLGCSEAEARDHIDKTDRGRQRHLKTRFGSDIDDPHLYDLVINTDRMTTETAAHLVVEGVRHRLADLGAPRPVPSWKTPAPE
jgi:hypothetical protein